MCGFIFSIGNSSSKKKFQEALLSIKHRGPDDTRFFFEEDKNIKIGFNRLNILDKINGEQPFFSNNKKIILLFNGEIYNSLDLRNLLINKGHKFHSINSDTETVMRSYEEWGDQCFKYFDGMFSIVLIDLNQNLIYGARDIFGEKPFYYFVNDKQLIISSELRVFKYLIHTSINKTQLKRYFIFSHIPAPNTILNGVYKLRNSHFIRFNLNTLKFDLNEYYEISNRRISLNSKIINYEKIDNIFRESVKSRTNSDYPIGTFLSGGIDSTLIAIYLNELGISHNSYSIAVEGKTYDESKKAQKIANFFGSNHEIIDLNKNNFNEYLNSAHNFIDEPLFAPSFLPIFVLSKFSSIKNKVILSGDGGDEIFGGYEMFKFCNLYNYLNVLSKKINLKNIIKFFPVSEKNASFDFKLRRLFRGFSVKKELMQTFFLSSIDLLDLEELFNDPIDQEDLFSDIFEFNKKYKDLDNFNKMILYYVQYYLPDLVASRADKAGMYNSIEIRSPYLNKKIFEYYLSLQEKDKNSIFSTKKILKKIINSKLGNDINLDKTGLTFPMQKWIHHTNLNLKNLSSGDINLAKLNSIIHDHFSNKGEFRNFLFQYDLLNKSLQNIIS